MGGSTDEWQRTPPDVVVDVPLTGPGLEHDAEHDDRPSGPNWRRSIGVALAGGLFLGIVLSVVLLNDDEPTTDDESAATLTPDELASRITTPPTLTPLTPMPAPDDPALARADEASPPPTSPVPTRDAAVPTVPQYPDVVVTTGDEAELAPSDLGAAVGRLGDDAARRSTTHVELGASGFVLDVTITRDPERDRYEIVVESRGATQVAIVDNASGTTFLDVGTDERQQILNREIIAGSGAATVNEFFDRLLLGPLRQDTIDEAAITPRGVVAIDGVGVARRFDVTMSGSLVPEWQLYAFSPVFEFPVEDRPATLDYSVYVDRDGRIVQIDGVSLVGEVAQVVQHRIELLDPPVPIVIVGPDGEVTGDELVVTPTTSPVTSPVTSP